MILVNLFFFLSWKPFNENKLAYNYQIIIFSKKYFEQKIIFLWFLFCDRSSTGTVAFFLTNIIMSNLIVKGDVLIWKSMNMGRTQLEKSNFIIEEREAHLIIIRSTHELLVGTLAIGSLSFTFQTHASHLHLIK